MRNAVVRKITELAEKNEKIILMTGDLGYNVLNVFWEKFPERFFNAGIAEQNMMAVAAGMALENKIVFAYSVANFPTLRCLEQIRNDCAYHQANVKIVSIGGGFAYGSLGMTHHATEDIGVIRALPNMTVISPGDLTEAEKAVEAICKINGPCYLRLGKGGEKRLHSEEIEFTVGKALEVKSGSRAAIFTTGAILEEAIEAAERLREKGIDPYIFSFHTIKPIDADTIRKVAGEVELIITLEEHNIIGGLGSAVAEVLAENEKGARLRRMGLNDTYSGIVGNQKYLRKYYHMDAESVAGEILNVLGKGE